MKKTQKGFTLVELMIVVAIIGILAAIAIPKFAQMLEKSREGATKGNISAVKSAISIYYGDHEGVYPDDLTQRFDSLGFVSIGWSFLDSYMDELPTVKVTGNNENVKALALASVVDPSKGDATVQYYLTALTDIPAGWYGEKWAYNPAEGKIWVNSALPDSKNDSYATYGYE